MIRQYISFAMATGIAIAANTAFANTDPFVEHNGRLIVEIEEGAAQGAWSVENSIEGHTGDGYLVWDGTNNYARSEAPRGNPIQYNVRIENPGNYELRWRSRNTVGLDATEHNDSWVRFPSGGNIEGQHFLDGWTKAYMGQVAQWTWDAYTVDNDNKPIRQYFNAGDHLIEIAGRSNGHGLDRFALFRYEQEAFDVALFDALTASPKASQTELASHAFAGNTCIGNTLSLAAESAVVFSDVSSYVGGDAISLVSPQQNALLRFDIPQLPIVRAALKLANSQPNAGLSAYLGSHSDWTTLTPVQELPYASLLLGTYNFENSQNQIQSLSLEENVAGSGQLTIVLRSDNELPHTIYGISSALEPRLDISVSDTFCFSYQAIKTGMQLPNSPDRDTFSGDDSEPSGQAQDVSLPDNLVTDTNIDTAAGSQDSPSPFDVIESQTEVNDEVLSDIKVTKKAGALSGWTLFAFALVCGYCKLRERRQTQLIGLTTKTLVQTPDN